MLDRLAYALTEHHQHVSYPLDTLYLFKFLQIFSEKLCLVNEYSSDISTFLPDKLRTRNYTAKSTYK